MAAHRRVKRGCGTTTARRQKRALLKPVVLLGAVALAALLLGQDTATATSFSPTGTVVLADSAPGATSDITDTFELPAPDANFAGVISFTPADWSVAADADIPDGALVADLTSVSTLGLFNNPCNTALSASFQMMDATTSTANQTTFSSQFADDDADGIPNGAELYPDYLMRIPLVAGLTPRARIYGQTHWAAAGINISVNLLVFEPGTNLGSIDNDPALGYPSVTVLQNGRDPVLVPAPSPITDFCSSLSTTTTTFGVAQDNPASLADERGATYRSNPAADGTYNFTRWAASERDADDDGHENPLDPCPFDPDPDWDPRASDPVHDPDSDGLTTCDPNPSVPSQASAQQCPSGNTGRDEDQDCYSNRQDNCPLVPNGLAESNQADADSDGIGDMCDPNPSSPDGHVHITCVMNPVDIGGGGSPTPADPHSLEPCAVDTDGDGILDTNDACPNQPEDFDSFQDGDGCPEPCPGGDLNGDGRVDLRDLVLVVRAFGSRPGDRRWNPTADLNHNGRVDLGDVFVVLRSSLDPTCRPAT